MESIEKKLETYRLRKRRQEKVKRLKEALKKFIMLGVKDVKENEGPHKTVVPIQDCDADESSRERVSNTCDMGEYDDTIAGAVLSENELIQNNWADGKDSQILKYTIWFVYFAFWVTLYIIAIELQFGIVFLMLSTLAGIYFNTRTGPKKKNEISAYSVFNENCESIDGTLKAEQFEREIGIR